MITKSDLGPKTFIRPDPGRKKVDRSGPGPEILGPDGL